ncbi:glycosyltransferase family 2 protein [Solwaraspora sp. WMMD406]|uniref:glycosyltransferase family 2 protein n=1 Tax=Solwaraspora sp. WMMD406 TaxID=3016095 RepID=UPI0024181220|nr:glycosyltransferase family 2 protein [Solwaraspora sp. WMMD406]MDG4764271.1 glycosyltransferase family 2 protein [Solwaraspora sp. WMMD406]
MSEQRRGELLPTTRVPAPVPDGDPGRVARVSVIIPCYNYGRFLPESVGSVFAQSGIDPEVIVVDDCSTDDTRQVLARLGRDEHRLVVVHNETNHGPCVAFNDGLAVATGEFIVRLDADDLLTPGSLARAVRLFDHFPQVGLVYGHPVHFHGPVPQTSRSEVTGWTVWSGADWIAHRCRLGVNCVTTPEAVVRASVYQEIGPWDSRMRYACDMEIWMRAAAVSDVGHVDGTDQALHREHPASVSVTDAAGRRTDLIERRTAFEVLFEGPGGKLPDAARLHDDARRALAVEALESACHAYDRRLTDREPVEWYVEFALETYPQARRLPQWRGLQRRQRVGARLAPLVPGFAASVVRRRLRNDARYRTWTRHGV